ncbi:hypothetical protein [Scytonema sp. NUACC26]|uniref:hypothetical protein n=1 Tax=Scytonema sp. NUACC26 TaxID=3140176 RepID=UPI0034DB88AA
MNNSAIDARISPQSQIFRPGGASVSFHITVNNDSEQFASFQLEVLAAGASSSSGHLWYRLSPEVSAAKPPGSSTGFQIIIFDTPLPGFVGTVNLTVRIFSPQLRQERRLVVRLQIEPGSKTKLISIDLLLKEVQVYPRNSVDIPVRVRNLSLQHMNAIVRLAGIEPSWLSGGAERLLFLEPNAQLETTFQCQPPSVNQAPSQDYPFTVEAMSRDGSSNTTQGILKVLPVGFVEFTATPQQQTLPHQGQWLPNWRSNSAEFELLFKNASNLSQRVNVVLQGKNHCKLSHRLLPENAELSISETTKVILEASTKRPWIGWAKVLHFDLSASLSDPRLGSTEPPTQSLELRVLPVLPLWLQLTFLGLLAALLALLFKPDAIAHADYVNVVRFSTDALSAVSGSDDRTIRRWRINGNRLEPEGNNEGALSKGVLGNTKQRVWALRFDPVENNHVAAGLDNSVIQIWNVARRKHEYELSDPELVNNTDKVFDLVFTKDRRYLISGHGSGKVLIWERKSATENFQPQPQQRISLGYQARSMALSQDEQTLAIAGNNKYLTLLDLNQTNRLQRRFSVTVPGFGRGDNDYIWGLAFAPQAPGLLATADSNGYITILDLKCQMNRNKSQSEEISQDCVRDRWEVGKQGVRSIAFAPDSHQLVSAGDNGRVVAWLLTNEGKREVSAFNGREIKRLNNQKLNSIDVNSENTTIITGGENCQVNRQGVKHCSVNLLRLNE